MCEISIFAIFSKLQLFATAFVQNCFSQTYTKFRFLFLPKIFFFCAISIFDQKCFAKFWFLGNFYFTKFDFRQQFFYPMLLLKNFLYLSHLFEIEWFIKYSLLLLWVDTWPEELIFKIWQNFSIFWIFSIGKF